jgi:hypothetical protein
MTARLAACLVFCLALYLGQLYIGLPALRLILLALILLIPITWLGLQLSRRQLKIDQSLTDPILNRRMDGHLVIHLQNHQMAAFGLVNLHIQLPGATEQSQVVIQKLTILPGDDQATTLTYPCPHCGDYALGLTAIYISDLFGLFRIRLKRPAYLTRNLLCQSVLPRVDLTSPVQIATLLLKEQTDRSGPARSSEIDALANLRPIQPGDSLKRIHWKVSARLGELHIKEFEDPLQHEVLILLDPALHRLATLKTLANPGKYLAWFDRTAEVVMSVIASYLQKRQRLTMVSWLPMGSTLPTGSLQTSVSWSPHREPVSGSKPDDLLHFQWQLCRLATRIRQSLPDHLRLDPDENLAEQLFLETNTQAFGCVMVVTWELSDELVYQLVQARLQHPRVCLILFAENQQGLEIHRDWLEQLAIQEVDCLLLNAAEVSL